MNNIDYAFYTDLEFFLRPYDDNRIIIRPDFKQILLYFIFIISFNYIIFKYQLILILKMMN